MGKMETSESTAALARPRSLHHTAYVTHDSAATVAFYTDVLGMKLVSTVIDDRIPSTGDPYPYIHIFFEMEDGSTIAFFESLGLPPPAPPSHPAYDIFNHLALDVGTKENVDRWIKRLQDKGIDIVGPTDHGIIYSVYFHDPNGLRLELTANVSPTWRDHEEDAKAEMDAWESIKKESRETNNPALVIDWIQKRRARHKLPADPD